MKCVFRTPSWKESESIIKVVYISTLIPGVLRTNTAWDALQSIALHAEQTMAAIRVRVTVTGTALERQLRSGWSCTDVGKILWDVWIAQLYFNLLRVHEDLKTDINVSSMDDE